MSFIPPLFFVYIPSISVVAFAALPPITVFSSAENSTYTIIGNQLTGRCATSNIQVVPNKISIETIAPQTILIIGNDVPLQVTLVLLQCVKLNYFCKYNHSKWEEIKISFVKNE